MTSGATVNNARHLAIFIRQQRMFQGVTQEQLAQQIGKSRKWVSKVEGGTLMPTFPAALKAVKALGFNVVLVKDETNDAAFLDNIISSS